MELKMFGVTHCMNLAKKSLERFAAQFGHKKNLFRVIFPLAIVILIWMMLSVSSYSTSEPGDTVTFKSCYRHTEMIEPDSFFSIELFEDVLVSDRLPKINKTIFFFVAECSANRLVRLDARQVVSGHGWSGFIILLLFFSTGKHVPSNRPLEWIQIGTFLCYSHRQLVLAMIRISIRRRCTHWKHTRMFSSEMYICGRMQLALRSNSGWTETVFLNQNILWLTHRIFCDLRVCLDSVASPWTRMSSCRRHLKTLSRISLVPNQWVKWDRVYWVYQKMGSDAK